MANKYDNIVRKALKLATKKRVIKESKLPYTVKERMHRQLEEELRDGKTSLGKNPILPDGEDVSFTEKIMAERFDEVVNNYKRVFDVEEIDDEKCIKDMRKLVNETMKMESEHNKELVELAINMVREEYGMTEDLVEITAELGNPKSIDVNEFAKNLLPRETQMEFEDHSQISSAKNEVDKRRFINAMSQGAAMKTNHMYHMVGDDLTKLNPRLPNMYNKMMSNVDYLYMIQPNFDEAVAGGQVNVEMPKNDGDKPHINANAVSFPVLVHEIVKGVMEIISSHGLPEDEKMSDYAIAKADFGAAELWDMRLGPALWGRFTNMLGDTDWDNKHHIYAEMCSLPTDEFMESMREVLAGTNRGKTIMKEFSDKVNDDLSSDAYEEKTGERPVNPLDLGLEDL